MRLSLAFVGLVFAQPDRTVMAEPRISSRRVSFTGSPLRISMPAMIVHRDRASTGADHIQIAFLSQCFNSESPVDLDLPHIIKFDDESPAMLPLQAISYIK